MLRVLLFTGKGGAGTTTCAAATAVHTAAAGAKTLLMSTGAAGSLGDVVGTWVGRQPVELAAGLYVAECGYGQSSPPVDVAEQLAAAFAAEWLPTAGDDVVMPPGAGELAAVLAIHAQAASGRWDAVVVDCGPFADALRVLTLPALGMRHAERRFSLPRNGFRATPSGEPTGTSTRARALDGAVRLHAGLRSVRDVLADAATTSVTLVTTSQQVAIAQTRRAVTAFALHALPVGRIIVNRVPPHAAPDVTLVEELAASWDPVTIQQVGDRPAEPIGIDALSVVGNQLPGVSPTTGEPLSLGLDVSRTDTGFVLALPLPLARRDEIDLVRAGDELIIRVHGQTRAVLLPSALRRCTVTGAELRAGRLSVSFTPDPDLWPRQ